MVNVYRWSLLILYFSLVFDFLLIKVRCLSCNCINTRLLIAAHTRLISPNINEHDLLIVVEMSLETDEPFLFLISVDLAID
jgi:hypothetical protein